MSTSVVKRVQIVDFSTYAATHCDEECLDWLKEAKSRKHLIQNLAPFLFCCIVHGRFGSLQYLINQLTQQAYSSEQELTDDTTSSTDYSNTIMKIPIISVKRRKEFVDAVPGSLHRKLQYVVPSCTSIAAHYTQVVKNSALKMVSHCMLDYLLFDCSTYKSSMCLTESTGSSWFSRFNRNAKGRFYMQSYYIPDLLYGYTDDSDGDHDINALDGVNDGKWYSNYMVYDFRLHCKDDKEFVIIMQQLEHGIKIYKQLLDKYPSMQFITTFCRELPHLYGQSLLNQTYIKPLVKKKDIFVNANVKDYEFNVEEYEFTDNCNDLFSDLFDKYADLGKNDTETLTSKQEMTVEQARKFMFSCGARYVCMYV